jgi:hypothetical protein
MRQRSRSSSGDTRYLERHGQQWRAVVYVPRHLRPIIGKAAFRRGLKTDSLAVAQVKRWVAVAEFQAAIAHAEARAKAAPLDPITADALGSPCQRIGLALKLSGCCRVCD